MRSLTCPENILLTKPAATAISHTHGRASHRTRTLPTSRQSHPAHSSAAAGQGSIQGKRLSRQLRPPTPPWRSDRGELRSCRGADPGEILTYGFFVRVCVARRRAARRNFSGRKIHTGTCASARFLLHLRKRGQGWCTREMI